MKPLQHIKELLDEMHRIQWHGHCRKNAAAWAAVSDIEIAIHELRKSFEQNINQPPRRLSGASEMSTSYGNNSRNSAGLSGDICPRQQEDDYR